MRSLSVGLLVLTLGVTAPAAATAQGRGRVPHTESTALGIDFGAFVPSAGQLDNSTTFDVLYDYYVTPRVSLRPAFGWSQPEFNGSGVDTMRQTSLRMDADYNWEGGKWHPFVGTGFGAYFLQFRNNAGTIGDTETKPGFNFGGGVEYFFNRSVSLKGEGRYYEIAKARGISPSGLAITAGIKTYF